MTNREKWSPVIDKAFADDIPLVDLLETIWQQAKKDYVPLIQEIHDKVAKENYDNGYADAIDDVIRTVRNHHPDIIKMIEQLKEQK